MYRAVFRDQGVPRVEYFVSLGAALGLFLRQGRELRPVALWQPESNTLLVGRSYLATQEAWEGALLEARAALGLDPSHVFGAVAAFDDGTSQQS